MAERPLCSQPSLGMLDRLPRTVREEIYFYLLSVDAVKTYLDRATELELRDEGKPLYKFEVAIFRTNQEIFEEAQEVFKRNGIVKVVFNAKDAKDRLRGRISSKQNTPVNFYWECIDQVKGIKLDVTVVVQPCNCLKKQCASSTATPFPFIVFREELNTLAAWFHGFNGFLDNCLETTFQLQEPMTDKQQEQLLFPFRKMAGYNQLPVVNFLGKYFDKRVMSQTRDAMTPKALWLRGFCWSVYQNCLGIKKDGDQAFLAGHMTRASTLYERAGHTLIKHLNNLEEWNFDEQLIAAFHRLDAIIAANQMLAMAHDEKLPSRFDPCAPECCTCRPVWKGENKAPPSFYSTICVLHRAAHITAGVERNATGPCTCLIKVKAAGLRPLFDVIANAMYTGQYGTDSTMDSRATDGKSNQQLVNTVRSLLPVKPFGNPKVHPYSTTVATYERAIARAIGVPALESDILVDDPHVTIRAKVVNQHAKRLLQDFERRVKYESRLPKDQRTYHKIKLNMKVGEI